MTRPLRRRDVGPVLRILLPLAAGFSWYIAYISEGSPP